MKNSGTLKILRFIIPSMLLFFVCSCTQKYKPASYQSAQDRFGIIELQTSKKFYLCPTIDNLPSACRKLLHKTFTPYEYATDAIEKELVYSGVIPERFKYETGPYFKSLQDVIKEKSNKSENAIYLGTELLWLDNQQLSLDAKLYNPSGEIVFEKRGICLVFGPLNDPKGKEGQEIAHMTIRQILNDPKFNQVLQK